MMSKEGASPNQDNAAMTLEEYNNPCVLSTAFASSVGYLVGFVVIFFTSRGPENEWPYAWWSMCFLGMAMSQFFNVLQSFPAKVTLARVVAGDDDHKENTKGYQIFNYCGRELEKIRASFDMIDHIEHCNKNWRSKLFGDYVCIYWTEEGYQTRKDSVWRDSNVV